MLNTFAQFVILCNIFHHSRFYDVLLSHYFCGAQKHCIALDSLFVCNIIGSISNCNCRSVRSCWWVNLDENVIFSGGYIFGWLFLMHAPKIRCVGILHWSITCNNLQRLFSIRTDSKERVSCILVLNSEMQQREHYGQNFQWNKERANGITANGNACVQQFAFSAHIERKTRVRVLYSKLGTPYKLLHTLWTISLRWKLFAKRSLRRNFV